MCQRHVLLSKKICQNNLHDKYRDDFLSKQIYQVKKQLFNENNFLHVFFKHLSHSCNLFIRLLYQRLII